MYYANHHGITGVELVGAAISTGIFAGIGIIYGHELSHTKGFSFVISRLMMGLSGSSHFSYAHVYNHHLELAHEDDPATSPRGRTYLPITSGCLIWVNLSSCTKWNKRVLAKLGKSFVSLENRWIRGYLMSLPTMLLFTWAGGAVGIAAMFLSLDYFKL